MRQHRSLHLPMQMRPFQRAYVLSKPTYNGGSRESEKTYTPGKYVTLDAESMGKKLSDPITMQLSTVSLPLKRKSFPELGPKTVSLSVLSKLELLKKKALRMQQATSVKNSQNQEIQD